MAVLTSSSSDNGSNQQSLRSKVCSWLWKEISEFFELQEDYEHPRWMYNQTDHQWKFWFQGRYPQDLNDSRCKPDFRLEWQVQLAILEICALGMSSKNRLALLKSFGHDISGIRVPVEDPDDDEYFMLQLKQVWFHSVERVQVERVDALFKTIRKNPQALLNMQH